MSQFGKQMSEKDSEFGKRTLTTEESLTYMYKCSIHTDVTLQTSKDGVSMNFPAHKLVLSLRSAVFADMFFQKFQNVVAIKDVSTRALDILLWYIYSDNLESNIIDELIESFEAAQKFHVCSFYNVCVQKFLENSADICASNVCSVLKIAKLTESDELRIKCLQIIENKTENVILSQDFLSVDKETIRFTLKDTYSKMCPTAITKSVLRWMKRNRVKDKTILSNIDFSFFSIDEFISIVQEYPKIFKGEEVQSILSNLLQPGSSDLPQWCKFTRTKPTHQKIVLYQGMEHVKENAIQIFTDCSCMLNKASFLNQNDFYHEMLLKVVVSSCSHKLVMLELAFGSDFIPLDNLTIELFSNTGEGKRMQLLKYNLIACHRHYYLLLHNDSTLNMNRDFNLCLKIQGTELKSWIDNGPVSSHQFRVVSVPSWDGRKIIPTRITKKFHTILIKPFDDLLIILDPKTGSKHFIVSSLFFDSTENVKKYFWNRKS